MNALKSPLMRQLALIISLLILGVEAVLLVVSVESKERELNGLRDTLNQQVLTKTGKSFNELHPGVLDSADIKKRMAKYSRNIVFLTALITLIVAIGSMIIFYRVAGRHLVQLKSLNEQKKTSVKEIPRYPAGDIPINEIGDVIHTREMMLDQLEQYELYLEKKLELAEERLVQSAKLSLVGEFTAGIIHDIKNPLTVILNYSQMIASSQKREKLGNEKVDRGLEKINLAAQRLHKLVDRMGKFGRSQENFKSNANLIEVIENSLLFTESKIKKNHIKVEKVLPENAFLYGDENSLEQVITNLISNACDAMENSDKKDLTLFVDFMNDKFIVEITDTGTGMNEETLENIFNSFFTTKEEGKGTGLGLANVAEIMDNHHAEIRVDSTPGVGTTFILILNKNQVKESTEKISA